MKRGVCIGVDTSCYTTSVAAVDEHGVLLCQQRQILPVKAGECGLRQSDALYQHVCKLPDLFRQLLSDLREICDYEIKCVCVSATPRSLDESYMPVFRAGHAFAKTMAECWNVPLYITSHQIGHLLAGTHASGIHFSGDFLAIHLSGGTCEMLQVDHDTYEGKLIGATKDNSAGQMIDRIGVSLGLQFPAGVHMEVLAGGFADENADINCIPVSVKDLSVSFAGPASALKRMVESGEDPAYIAMCTYSTVARTLVKWMANALKETGVRDVLIMGGVASSSILRKLIAQRVAKQCRALRVHYADAPLASDNAVGVAIYGALKHKGDFKIMSAKILDGKALAASIREDLAEKVNKLVEETGVKPTLAVIVVGDDPASAVYVRNKEKACIGIGMGSIVDRLPEQTTQVELETLVAKYNADPSVHGILVQLPLPKHLDEARILELIDPKKDVDGFHAVNMGALVSGTEGFVPCTPKGILRLIAHSGIDMTGKHAVVVGRSNIVGKPVALMLLANNATVTVCHSKTDDLAKYTRDADILVVAVGRPNLVKGDMVKPGAVVIDAGINRTEAGLVGDVEFSTASEVADAITPVPGGVGPMTIAMLLENTYIGAKNTCAKA